MSDNRFAKPDKQEINLFPRKPILVKIDNILEGSTLLEFKYVSAEALKLDLFNKPGNAAVLYCPQYFFLKMNLCPRFLQHSSF